MKLIILLVLITFSENIIKVTLLDLNIKNTKSEYVNLGNLSKDKDEIHSIVKFFLNYVLSLITYEYLNAY